MKNTNVLCALLLLIAPAYATHPDGAPDGFLKTVLSDVGILNNGLWVVPDTSNRNDNSRHFRITIIPNQYTASAVFEIQFGAPQGQTPEPVAHLFDHDGIEWPISNYAYQSGSQYFIYLHELQAHRKIEFSLVLKNTSFAKFHITALLTVNNEQESVEWLGWIRRDINAS